MTGRVSEGRARFVGRLFRIDYLEHELAEGGLLGLLHEIHRVRWRPVLLRDVFEGDCGRQPDLFLDLLSSCEVSEPPTTARGAVVAASS